MKQLKRHIKLIRKPYILKEYLKNKKNIIPYKLKKTRAFYPLIVYFVINVRCNLKCLMCDIGQKQRNSQFYYNLVGDSTDLPLYHLKKIIDDIASFKPEIVFSSTEPLLYKDIIEAINYVKKKKLRCRLTTNGFLLPNFAEKLVDSGLDELLISIDGPEKIHDYVRGIEGTFKRIRQGIIKIHEYKNKTGKKYPIIRINTTITEHSYTYLYETVKQMKRLKVFDVTINHLNFVTKEMKETHNKVYKLYPSTESSISKVHLNKIDTDVLFNEIQKIKKDFYDFAYITPDMDRKNTAIYYKNPLKFVSGHDRCTVPWRVSQIKANGDVIPLTRCFNVVMGNAIEQNFKKIWNNEKYRAFRALLLKKKALPACSRCCGVF